MAKRVYFCFHYQDVIDFRANVVRNHWITKPDRESAGFFDASIWEAAKKNGSIALKRLINSGLYYTSATCVLVGTDTFQRPWVRYEIFKSIEKGNKLIGVHINHIKDRYQNIKPLGNNPFDYLGVYFNEDSSKYAFIEKRNDDQWYYYEEIDSKRWFNNDFFQGSPNNISLPLSIYFKIYNWIGDDGYNNFAAWI